MIEPSLLRYSGRDGEELAYREIGVGRPLVLLHGFSSDSSSWIDPGPAWAIAERRFRVILPDLRGHGGSSRSHDPRHYPADVLVDDGLALIDHLALEDYDLGGSRSALGSRCG